MKEIIPIKKDIIFKTTIGKITNIELNPEYNIKDGILNGNVILSGSYKMMESSVIEEDFYYKIPFGITLSEDIKKDTIKLEIDDFNYDINKDVMSAKIDLEFTCEKEEPVEEINNYFKEENILEENNNVTEIVNEEENVKEEIHNITNNIITDNKYYTYKVYIVRNGDSIESICNKYNTSIDVIKEYNDISNINIGDKIIIPNIND